MEDREQEPPPVPNVQWETTEVANDAGAATRVEIEFQSGESIAASTLSVRIDGTTVVPPSADTEATAGTTLATSFDGDGAGPGAGSELRLVWSAPDGDDTYTLVSHTLVNDAAGGVAAEFDVE